MHLPRHCSPASPVASRLASALSLRHGLLQRGKVYLLVLNLCNIMPCFSLLLGIPLVGAPCYCWGV